MLDQMPLRKQNRKRALDKPVKFNRYFNVTLSLFDCFKKVKRFSAAIHVSNILYR